MLLPKKVKFRKWQTGRTDMSKVSPDTRGTSVSFGSFGLKSTTGGRIRSNQLEAARKVASRTISKTGKMWIRAFPDRPFTAKPAEVGMGKGKGDPQGYCLDIRPGRVIFEVDVALLKQLLVRLCVRLVQKLPIKTNVVAR